MADAAALHLEMYEAVEQRDFAHLRDLYHPDYVYMAADGKEQPGADAGVAVAETYTTAFPDLHFTITHQYVVSGDVSVLELTGSGTHLGELEGIPATGKTITVVACNVVEVKDGKIWREREYYDALSLMQQLGVIPEEG